MVVVRISDRERQGTSLVHVGRADEVIDEVESIERHSGLRATKFASVDDDDTIAAYNVGEPGDATADGVRVEAIYYAVRG